MGKVRKSRLQIWGVTALVLAAVPCAAARQEYVPIEPGVADRGPLSTSLRDLSVDLRQPTNFDHIYRVPGAGDRYLRANGGLYAVFPRSVYTRSRFGEVPQIPDGTVFYIGAPPDETQPRTVPASRSLSYRVNGRLDATVPDASAPAAPRRHPLSGHRAPVETGASEEVPSTIITDPVYRAARIRQLMRRAAAARALAGS